MTQDPTNVKKKTGFTDCNLRVEAKHLMRVSGFLMNKLSHSIVMQGPLVDFEYPLTQPLWEKTKDKYG